MGKLNGKVAIVTGASRGIGVAIAELFASEGAKVVCAARTLHEGDHSLFAGSLETTVAAIVAAGGEATAVPTDVTKEEDCQRLVEMAREAYGPCDVLVNNAAFLFQIPVADYPASRRMLTFAANFHAPFLLSQLVLTDMIPRHRGAIVNISSVVAVGPGRGPYQESTSVLLGGALYGAQKAALERLTQGMAHELYQHGISVTCVAPSTVVPTPGTRHIFRGGTSGGQQSEPPELQAKAVLLLATEPLDRVTGRVTYSQQILKEFGWIESGRGAGVDQPGTGFSQI